MSQRMDEFKRTPWYWLLMALAVLLGIVGTYLGWWPDWLDYLTGTQ